ncbi:MAG TPA: addiction module toxin RelE [Chloroflexota bacterium]|jgi:mRNA-degrading endonuclease RelE of RelBE toxin-antitoxin system|nr:addiction module toxin RelE [Chloroflexota bacterium]
MPRRRRTENACRTYRITYTRDAELDIRALRKQEQARLYESVPRYLTHEPAAPSNARQPLDPNPFEAPWELRLGELRVLYAIDEPAQTVEVLRAGRKQGNRLFLRGVPVEMRLL